MSVARIRLLVAFALFAGWLGWLAVAVYEARHDPARVPVVSRAQLLAANVIVVADVGVDAEDGLPSPTATVSSVVRGPVSPNTSINVLNLKSALPSGADRFPGAGKYLLPLVADGKSYRIAGLPRSPGYEPAQAARPRIYVWNDRIETQVNRLGFSAAAP